VTKPDGELTRLRDLEAAPGSIEADLAALVRAGVGGPPRAGSKARVRAALMARRAPSRAAWLRPVVVVSLLLLAGAGARAARGPGWGQTLRRLVAWVAPAPVAPPTRRSGPAPMTVSPPEAPSATLEAVPVAPAPVAIGAEVRTTPRPPRHLGHAAVVGNDEDPTLVATAVRALRRDHDAARAGALLDEYLRRWPEGALAEEALALSIEAAQASGGAARTRTLAVRYLQRFPSGRFVETAHRALVPASTP
jgi:hypothetical protein